MNATVTDSKFLALKSKLRELFELDKSDLDFGIYRIIAAKNKEVTEFLDRQLKDAVKATLAAHGAGAADQVQAELDKTIANLRAAEVPDEQIEANKKVSELRAKLAAAGGAAATDLEADIYNHLLAFFGRYYDEGDFISKRRYKGDIYAIPYGGEEVTLHWANKDQYYIKSGEWHKDYRFKVGGGDKTVRFKLVDATQEVANNKEADDAKRRYILATENPVEATASELTLRFEFRVPTQADKDLAAAGAVAVFGGDYAKPTNPKKGDEREQFCADAEKRAIASMIESWKSLIASPGTAATADKPARTLLGKHLDHFTARNTFDYFIHKDLGGFLRRELDFYLKNEVVRLDDLESLPPDHLQRVQGKIKAIRAVASRLIAFLSALEDFQKKMWLKKKFVLNTNWLVTIDRIPSALRDVVAQNAEQWAEWERLGFKPEHSGDAGLFGGATWGTRAYLDACDKLVVDTRFFGRDFTSALLSDDLVLNGASTLDGCTLGTVVSGDNFHALRLLLPVLRSRVQGIYIDPPYNTSASEIVYKNGYRSSSWASMIADRIRLGRLTLRDTGAHCYTIDDYELATSLRLLDSEFGSENHLATVPIRNNPQGRSTVEGFAVNHEYALFHRVSSSLSSVGRLDRTQQQIERYRERDAEGRRFLWDNLRKTGTDSERSDRPKQYFPLYLHPDNTLSIPSMEWIREQNAWHVVGDTPAGASVVFPDTPSGEQKCWKKGVDTLQEILPLLRAERDGKRIEIYSRGYLNDSGRLPGTWWDDAKYAAGSHGTNLLSAMFAGARAFSFPKSLYAVQDCLRVLGVRNGDTVLDYFGGSGTTAHAVIELNRTEKLRIRFVTVEMGEYIRSVMLPRIVKAFYSPSWSEGRALDHGAGVSVLAKYIAVESYEDSLNNLPSPSGELLKEFTDFERDSLLTYSLDLELGPCLLNLDAFRDPWGYTVNAQLAGDAEIKRHSVDLVETFNYLIGLTVSAYGPLERYSAEFERSAHADGLGRVKLTGRLRRDGDGPFVFQRVEGELNDSNGTRVLVVWRKLTDDPEMDAAVLDAWMARHRESTRERTEYRDYHLIYVNGPVTLPQPTAELRTVYPTEETFKFKMFEDTDSPLQMGGQHG